MENPVTRKIEKETVRMLFGFRSTYIMILLSKFIQKHGMIREADLPQYPVAILLLQELNNIFKSRTSQGLRLHDILKIVESMSCTLRMAKNDLLYVWPKALEVNDFGNLESYKILDHTHDMPVDIINAYVESMSELHRFTDFNFKPLRPYLEGKRVLDFGCGSGFFLHEFSSIKDMNRPKIVFGVDRLHILEGGFDYSKEAGIMKTSIGEYNESLSVICEFGVFHEKFLDGKIEPFDTIWLSEVIHGKEKPIEFIADLAQYIGKKGVILINEVCDASARSEGFDTQMLLHCGSPYSRKIGSIYKGSNVLQISSEHSITVIRINKEK